MRRFFIPIAVLLFGLSLSSFKNEDKKNNETQRKDIKKFAPTPPMGWNSYNCYGAAVKESEVMANADYMANTLKKFGWQYIVVDYCWFYPHPPSSIQNNPPQFRLPKDGSYVPWMPMDKYGRLLPDPGKFPSAANGAGFRVLADYVHGLGLKFGIHVMRGIPRQAVWAKSPILGAPGIDASMIADTTSKCNWLNSMYGVDMSKPGAQEYYNSLGELYASWGVDFIKMDDIDMDENYPYRGSEAEAMHIGILNSQRPIVLSLSLNMKYENRDHIKSISNMWRVSKDFWDNWELLDEQFSLLNKWTPAREPGNWPDGDMLQLGWISRRGPSGPERLSQFTNDEQITHMTLWCIAQSPLMMGGDMPDNSKFVESLLTNQEVIEVNQNAHDAHQLFREGSKIVWTSKHNESNDIYVALFNDGETPVKIEVPFKDLGIKGKVTVRDLWAKKDMANVQNSLISEVNPHGAMIFRISTK